VIGLGAGLIYSWLTLPSTSTFRINGRAYEVLFYENHTLTTLTPTTGYRVDRLLWLKYLPTASDTGQIRLETQTLASGLCSVADSLGLPHIRVQAIIPIGTRVTRVTRTWDYWFEVSRQAGACTSLPVPDPRMARRQ
jgi:hypothetical protein